MDNISLTEILLTFLTVAFITVIFFIKALFQKMVIFKKQLDAINSDHSQLTSGFKALYHSIEHLEKSFHKIKDAQKDKEIEEKTKPAQRPHENTYNYATKLIEMGASLSEVKSTCQLKPQEAELIWAIHKKSQNY
jgi:hypothetical protein